MRLGGLAILAMLALSGCAPWAAYSQKIDGPYRLFAADDPDDVGIDYDFNNGSMLGLVDAKVVSYRWTPAYIVAARSVRKDQPLLYYYIDRAMGPDDHGVHGPFSAVEFQAETARLRLPPINQETGVAR